MAEDAQPCTCFKRLLNLSNPFYPRAQAVFRYRGGSCMSKAPCIFAFISMVDLPADTWNLSSIYQVCVTLCSKEKDFRHQQEAMALFITLPTKLLMVGEDTQSDQLLVPALQNFQVCSTQDFRLFLGNCGYIMVFV